MVLNFDVIFLKSPSNINCAFSYEALLTSFLNLLKSVIKSGFFSPDYFLPFLGYLIQISLPILIYFFNLKYHLLENSKHFKNIYPVKFLVQITG